MKCDELEKWYAGQFSPSAVVFGANEVEAAIAELKAENERLKSKLESVQASAYADSVDAGMREHRLRRALWLARAEKAKHIATFCYYALHYGRVPVREIYQCQDKWDEVERKCRAKAEEYR